MNAFLLVRSVPLVPLVSLVTLTTPLPLISLTTLLPRPFTDFLLAVAAVVSNDRVLDLSARIKLKKIYDIFEHVFDCFSRSTTVFLSARRSTIYRMTGCRRCPACPSSSPPRARLVSDRALAHKDNRL